MQIAFRFLAAAGPCGYLPEQTQQLEYERVADMSAEEYMQWMLEGWRRFGRTLFRPRCPACKACRPLRVIVDRFCPSRSQRRVATLNSGIVQRSVGEPSVTAAKLDLYRRYHDFQSVFKDWPRHDGYDAATYRKSFVDNPFPTEEWCYYLERRLVGVGYVDPLPAGLSAVYFWYDPAERRRSLGTWNILSILTEAARRGLPHVYLGYYVQGCRSMEYKAKFRPFELRGEDGTWQ